MGTQANDMTLYDLIKEFGSRLPRRLNQFKFYLKQLQRYLNMYNTRACRVVGQVQRLFRKIIDLVRQNEELSNFVAVMRDKDPKLHKDASTVLRLALLTFANEKRQPVEPPSDTGRPRHMKVVIIPFWFSYAFDLGDIDRRGTRVVRWCSFG